MTFLSPGFLWGLLLIAPLVGVYLLKVRPRRQEVTAIFLWDTVLTQRKANALLQRLRDVLSLLLLTLAALMLVFAAGRPRFDEGDTRDVLLLIDRSVSMSADFRDDRPGYSRFDAAIDRAESLLRSLGGQRRAAIATVDDRLDYAVLLTDEPRRLREALREITPGQLPSDDAALMSIRQLAGLSDELRIILLTDGVGVDLESPVDTAELHIGEHDNEHDGENDNASAPIGIETVRIDEKSGVIPENIGFIAADMVAANNGQTMTLMFSIASSFPDTVRGEAVLTAVGSDPDRNADDSDGIVIRVIPLEIVPGVNPPQIYGIDAEAGRYTLRLETLDENGEARPDALALDNTAYLSAPEPRPLRVAVDAADRYFFETAVLAFARSGRLMDLIPAGESAELAIFRGSVSHHGSDSAGPPLRVVFAPDAPGDGVASVGEPLDVSLPRVLLPDHPMLRFIPAESLRFDGARQVEAEAGSAVLVADVSGVPLIWQMRDPDTGAVTLLVNLDPVAADFVLSPYFPVLVYATATHLGGRTTEARSTFATGSHVQVPGLRPGERAEIRFADQTRATTDSTQPVRLPQAGFHIAQTPGDAYDLPASVLHPTESLLEPVTAAATDSEVELPGGYPPWMWLTAIALLVISAEEMLYHRRKVG